MNIDNTKISTGINLIWEKSRRFKFVSYSS